MGEAGGRLAIFFRSDCFGELAAGEAGWEEKIFKKNLGCEACGGGPETVLQVPLRLL